MTDATKKTKGLLLLVASFALVFIIAACTTEVIKEVPVEVIKEVIKEVPFETEVIKTVEVVKQVVVEKVVEVEVIKEVAVETEVIKTVEVVKEVAVVVIATPVPATPLVASGGQKYGGTIKLGVVDFGTMDPALMGLSEGSNLYSELTYDNAIVSDYDGELMPWALESWSANADASQYTLKVRQGITFHRGGEQNAKDIKFTFDRILDEATASPLQGVIDFITNIATPDDYTLVFEFSNQLGDDLTSKPGRSAWKWFHLCDTKDDGSSKD